MEVHKIGRYFGIVISHGEGSFGGISIRNSSIRGGPSTEGIVGIGDRSRNAEHRAFTDGSAATHRVVESVLDYNAASACW